MVTGSFQESNPSQFTGASVRLATGKLSIRNRAFNAMRDEFWREREEEAWKDRIVPAMSRHLGFLISHGDERELLEGYYLGKNPAPDDMRYSINRWDEV